MVPLQDPDHIWCDIYKKWDSIKGKYLSEVFDLFLCPTDCPSLRPVSSVVEVVGPTLFYIFWSSVPVLREKTPGRRPDFPQMQPSALRWNYPFCNEVKNIFRLGSIRDLTNFKPFQNHSKRQWEMFRKLNKVFICRKFCFQTTEKRKKIFVKSTFHLRVN